MPANAFGYVPTPALVAPIEFTLPRADYAALGGHMGRVRRVADVLAEAQPRAVVLPAGVRFRCGEARTLIRRCAPPSPASGRREEEASLVFSLPHSWGRAAKQIDGGVRVLPRAQRPADLTPPCRWSCMRDVGACRARP